MNDLKFSTEELALSTNNTGKLSLNDFICHNNLCGNSINMIDFKCPMNLNRQTAFLKLDYEFYLPLYCKADKKDKINSYRNYIKNFNHDQVISYEIKNNRLYSTGLSLQGFPKKFRNFLLSNCFDYDMKNCFPTILLKLTKDLNLPFKYLKKYVETRDTFLKRNKIQKNQILSLMNIDKPDLTNFTPSVNNLITEIIKNKKQIIQHHIDKIYKKENEVSNNPISSQIYSVLAYHENMLLSRIINQYKSKLSQYGCIPMYDGFATPYKINIETLNNLTEDFSITWKIENMESPLFYIPDLSTERSISNLFIDIYKNDLVKTQITPKDSEIYVWDNNSTWKINDSKNSIIIIKINQFINYIYNYFSKLTSDYFNNIRIHRDITADYNLLLEEFNQCLKLLNKHKSICDIASFIAKFIPIDNEKIIFDDQPDYLPFNDCLLDLKNGQTISHRKDLYITETIGYNYHSNINYTVQNEIIKMLTEIFPIQDERELIMYKLAHTLNGYNHPRFTILQGEGRNGKSVLLNLLSTTLGNFSYNLGNSICVSASKSTGANQEIAKADRKRFLWCSEPIEGDKFNFTLIKQLTGDKQINAREIYSKKTETLCCGDLWIACNDDIPLNITNDGEAVRGRIIEMQMRSLFINNPDPNVEYSFKANPALLEKTTNEKFKMDFIHLLIPYSIQLFKSNRVIDHLIPQHITELGLKYITKSNPFKSWFNSKFEKTSDINDFISIKDIFASYKLCDDYLNLTKKEKRACTYDSLISKLKRDPDTKLYFKEKLNDNVNKTCYRNIIRSYKIIPEIYDNNSQDLIDTDEDDLDNINSNATTSAIH